MRRQVFVSDQIIEHLENVVAFARCLRADYGNLSVAVSAPEFGAGIVRTSAAAAVRELFGSWGLDHEWYGTPRWNPLSIFIQPGARVVLKPNWVADTNKAGQGLDCLVTHASVIEAVLEYVALTKPGSVIIGDAPLQGCNFERLLNFTRVPEMVSRFRASGLNVSIVDFRRIKMRSDGLGMPKLENQRGMENYILFDLGEDSLLEALNADADEFRVTMYNPELLKKTHAPGKHQYLVAREVIDADVVINLPKLKTHKKACITGALKNLVGINGHKEYLPHHRKGGLQTGGDCYAGGSRLKGWAEDLLDAANRTQAMRYQQFLRRLAGVLVRSAKWLGEDENIEGSWYGNDTVWRTVLDLQRILRYGKRDGSLVDEPQRIVLSITDAIVGGEKEGPISPFPVPSAFVTAAVNPAAVEWVNARLMGFDPSRIPLTLQAFGAFRFPIASFDPEAISVRIGKETMSVADILPFENRVYEPPGGWHGHCERNS